MKPHQLFLYFMGANKVLSLSVFIQVNTCAVLIFNSSHKKTFNFLYKVTHA